MTPFPQDTPLVGLASNLPEVGGFLELDIDMHHLAMNRMPLVAHY